MYYAYRLLIPKKTFKDIFIQNILKVQKHISKYSFQNCFYTKLFNLGFLKTSLKHLQYFCIHIKLYRVH